MGTRPHGFLPPKLMNSLDKKFLDNIVGIQNKYVDYTDEISSSGDFKKIENVNVIIKSLINFLLTPLKTYPFDPTYGSELYKQVFELHIPETEEKIKNEVKNKIKQFDPRINIEDVELEYFDSLKGYRLNITINYMGNKLDIKNLDFDQSDQLTLG